MKICARFALDFRVICARLHHGPSRFYVQSLRSICARNFAFLRSIVGSRIKQPNSPHAKLLRLWKPNESLFHLLPALPVI